jgi:hypothetical protein
MDGGSARRKATTYMQSNTTQNKYGQTSMSRLGFELKILVFEQAKTFRALDGLDREATVSERPFQFSSYNHPLV